MFGKQSRNELKAFGLLLGFMAICGTLGTLFLSKIVLLLSSVSFLGNLFLFVVFLSVLGGVSFGLYTLGRKTIPKFSSFLSFITPYKEKVVTFLKNKKALYEEKSQSNGFIASFKFSWKSNKKSEK